MWKPSLQHKRRRVTNSYHVECASLSDVADWMSNFPTFRETRNISGSSSHNLIRQFVRNFPSFEGGYGRDLVLAPNCSASVRCPTRTVFVVIRRQLYWAPTFWTSGQIFQHWAAKHGFAYDASLTYSCPECYGPLISCRSSSHITQTCLLRPQFSPRHERDDRFNAFQSLTRKRL